MPALAKSRTLRVTNLHSCARAVAAIIESKAVMHLPCVSASTVMCAQTSETFWSNARIRFSKLICSCCSHSVSSDRRLDSGILATPRCNSPQVIALMQSSWALRASNQLRTWPSGVLLTSSESTQVSRKLLHGTRSRTVSRGRSSANGSPLGALSRQSIKRGVWPFKRR